MSRAAWQRARDEWRANRRLRLAGMAALAFVGIHLLLAMGDQRQALAEHYGRDVELQARLAGMQEQKDWPERAEQAVAGLAEMRAKVPAVTGAGLAQAEMQAWLTALAASNGLSDSRVKVEDTLNVRGYPDMWQVMARLDGKLPQYGQAGFLRELSEALPWIQAERLEIDEADPARVVLVVRGYYRQAGADEPAAVADLPPGSATDDSGTAPALPDAPSAPAPAPAPVPVPVPVPDLPPPLPAPTKPGKTAPVEPEEPQQAAPPVGMRPSPPPGGAP